MNSDGTYDQVTPDSDGAVRDAQTILMNATTDAVESGSELGISTEEGVLDRALLIETQDDTASSEQTPNEQQSVAKHDSK